MTTSSPGVVITGVGVVSPFGVGRDVYWRHVSRGCSGTKAITQFDVSVFKNTHVTEKVNLQLRLEMFNAFNNVNLGNPGTTLGTGTFGVISSTRPARVIQAGLKLLF